MAGQPRRGAFPARLFRGAIPAHHHAISRVFFLKALGLVYLVAFLSWWVQMPFLVGSEGLQPAGSFLRAVGEQLDWAWLRLPTVFWLNSSDIALHLGCGVGVVASLFLVTGWFTGPAAFVSWLLYLSLVSTGGIFLGYQWDALLIETGFLAILFAPWSQRRIQARTAPPLSVGSTLVLWMLWFLVAKLMWFSGWVKLAWGDPTWWPERTAMTYHYLTQPLPTWTSWYLHHLTPAFHKASLWPMYFIELVLPWCVLLGRYGRRLAALGFAALMLLIMASGNYGWFNLLTLVLCVPLLDNNAFRYLRLATHDTAAGSETIPELRGSERSQRWWRRHLQMPRLSILGIVALLNVLVCYQDTVRGARSLSREELVPKWLAGLQAWTDGFRVVNGYGLFRIMTTDRPEIIIEGSHDGRQWSEYHLRWKPGPLSKRPAFATPHMPRLAWQFWFLALERGYDPRSRNAAWFSALIVKLMENDPAALAWFENNPFAIDPPRYLRCRLYLYEFTVPADRDLTGQWWVRKEVGMFLAPVEKRARP